jgi:cell division transport system permease protein
MTRYLKQAIRDIIDNRFLSVVAIITIALSIFVVSAFGLFFLNAGDMMSAWERGIRVMVYLSPEITETERAGLQERIHGMYGVADVRFISKDEGLELLKQQMQQQASLLDNLPENPLPDAFEIRLADPSENAETIEVLAGQIEALPLVDDLEYGQQWIGRFVQVFSLLRLAGYAISCVFFMATAFIVANTIRLVLYSRREEVEIMRLVGATDTFIKLPFYFQGLLQGAIGGIMGIIALFITYVLASSRMPEGLTSLFFQIRFFPFGTCLLFILSSMAIGWVGCVLSLRQFLKA